MSTAIREIRPFPSVSPLDEFMSDIALRVGHVTAAADGRLTLSEDEYRHVPVSVILPFAGSELAERLVEIDDGLSRLDLSIDDIVLTVNLYSGFLKLSEYPYRIPFADLIEFAPELSLTAGVDRPAPLRAARSGCRVEIAAQLAAFRPMVVGKPWRKGTWLSRSRFNLSCDLDFSGFSPRPMDSAQKAVLGLGAKATRFVALPDGIDPLTDDVSADQIELWVDADLLAMIAAQDRSRISRAIQRQLFIDVIGTVATAAHRRPGFDAVTWDMIEHSLIGKFIRYVAGRRKDEARAANGARCQSLLLTLQDDPQRFIAYVEDVAGTTLAYMESLEG
jgi:hypothetical protein